MDPFSWTFCLVLKTTASLSFWCYIIMVVVCYFHSVPHISATMSLWALRYKVSSSIEWKYVIWAFLTTFLMKWTHHKWKTAHTIRNIGMVLHRTIHTCIHIHIHIQTHLVVFRVANKLVFMRIRWARPLILSGGDTRPIEGHPAFMSCLHNEPSSQAEQTHIHMTDDQHSEPQMTVGWSFFFSEIHIFHSTNCVLLSTF